jgi:PAS domain S-box-containing protein
LAQPPKSRRASSSRPRAFAPRPSHEAEGLADLILRATQDALLVLDDAGTVVRSSGAAAVLFGYGPFALDGRHVLQLLREAVGGDVQPARTPGAYDAVKGSPQLGVRQDGSTFPVEVRAVESDGCAGRQQVLVIHDLSSQRAAEEVLRQQEQIIEVAFDNAPLPTVSIAPDGRVLRANRAAAMALAYDVDELPGVRMLDLVAAEDRDGVGGMLRSVAAGEDQGLGGPEWHYLRKDGGLVIGRSHASTVRDASGEPAMLVLQFEDRTERRRIGQELARVRDDLAHVGRVYTVGELATGIAHEINQPLSAISSYAQACRFLIQGGRADAERLDDVLEKISECSRRAGAVIQRLRDFVRKCESERLRVGADELVRGVAQLVAVDARFQEIGLELDLPESSIEVTVDRVQIQQVLLNLLLNALDAMRDREDGKIAVRVTTAGEELVISVRDQGVGISPEVGERVFESFFSTKDNGMGVGLAISRSIVEAHGGRVWHTPNEGLGTTFHVALPIAVEADDAWEPRS